jgi:hypothetical protein
LDQVGELFLGQFARGEFQRHGILRDDIDANDLVGIDCGLGEEVVTGAFGLLDRNADPVGIDFKRVVA